MVRKFDDNCSRFGFLGDFPSVEAVKAYDRRQLEEILGTTDYKAIRAAYSAIGDRMMFFYETGRAYHRIIQVHPKLYHLVIGHRRREKIKKEIIRDEELDLIEEGRYKIIGTTGGIIDLGQKCPLGCDVVWVGDVFIQNTETGFERAFNYGIAHIWRRHHFMQKSKVGGYGMTMQQFYEHYMSDNPGTRETERIFQLLKEYETLVRETEREERQREKIEAARREREYNERVRRFWKLEEKKLTPLFPIVRPDSRKRKKRRKA